MFLLYGKNLLAQQVPWNTQVFHVENLDSLRKAAVPVPAHWHTWWDELKSCALQDPADGRSSHDLRVAFTPGITLRHYFFGDQEIWAMTFQAHRLIVIPTRSALSKRLVQHELLHYYLSTPNCITDEMCHPKEYDWCNVR